MFFGIRFWDPGSAKILGFWDSGILGSGILGSGIPGFWDSGIRDSRIRDLVGILGFGIRDSGFAVSRVSVVVVRRIPSI